MFFVHVCSYDRELEKKCTCIHAMGLKELTQESVQSEDIVWPVAMAIYEATHN